ncbi:MAG: Mpo1-like protein, partial [Vicinamibacterales bacterium]
TFGIPLIVASIVMAIAGFLWPALWWPALGLFVVGWILQFIGHALEGKPPEFFKDWRFLFVGLRWWLAKMAGKA